MKVRLKPGTLATWCDQWRDGESSVLVRKSLKRYEYDYEDYWLEDDEVFNSVMLVISTGMVGKRHYALVYPLMGWVKMTYLEDTYKK